MIPYQEQMESYRFLLDPCVFEIRKVDNIFVDLGGGL